MIDTQEIQDPEDMIPISATILYRHYLALEDESKKTETSLEEVIRDAIDLFVLVKQYQDNELAKEQNI